MRIVALEEHFVIPELTRRIAPERLAERGWPKPGTVPPERDRRPHLQEVGQVRLDEMDRAGITVQVLSASGPGADLLDPAEGTVFARDVNDWLAKVVAGHPTRYAGFAHLPTTAPEAAADELERAITDLGFRGALISGTTRDRFLDDPAFDPVLARAESLGVPIYLHPGLPPQTVRKTYTDGLSPQLATILAEPGWGWHAETALHILRLVVSGTLERHPGLQLIIGHMGEMIPMMLDRFDETFSAQLRHLSRRPSETIRQQVHVTTSGFFSLVPFMAALLAFGADRLMFSVDYPFSSNDAAMAFLRSLPVSPQDLAKIAHGNADRLLKLPA